MRLFWEVIFSIFAVFGLYCAIIEVWHFALGIATRKRKKPFDFIEPELYNESITTRKEPPDDDRSEPK